MDENQINPNDDGMNPTMPMDGEGSEEQTSAGTPDEVTPKTDM